MPLNAGNVLVVEDYEPATKWLSLINQSLNKSSISDSHYTRSTSFTSSDHLVRSTTATRSHASLLFPKTSLKRYSKNFQTEEKRKLKTCNCSFNNKVRKSGNKSCFSCQSSCKSKEDEFSSEDEDDESCMIADMASEGNKNFKYGLVVSKQMVGIFVTIWVKKELIQYIGHLRTSCITRGILGCLGNKVSL